MPGRTAPGVQMWWQSHIERYTAIVANKPGQVTLEIFGHIHVDTFYISRSGSARPGEGRAPSGVLWVGLSLVASSRPKTAACGGTPSTTRPRSPRISRSGITM